MRALPACLALLVGCGGEPPAGGLELPPPRLRDVRDELRALVDQAPAPPGGDRLDELRGLMLAAFGPEASDERLAARARRQLLDTPEAHWILEAGLQHESPGVRTHAAFQLGQLGVHASLLPLLLRLKYEQEPACLLWVADALARLGNHAALEPLAAMLPDGPRAHHETRRQAGEVAIAILERQGRTVGPNPSYAELEAALLAGARAWRELGHTGHPPADPDPLTSARLASLALDLGEFQLRPVDDARFVLARAGGLAMPVLRTALAASDNYLRNHALEVLRDLGRSAAALAPEVRPLLRDEISAPYAVQALGALGDRPAVRHVLSLLQSPVAELRTAAAGALGSFGDPAAAAPLRRLLRDPGAPLDERVHAAFSLAQLEGGGEGLAYLQARHAAQDYHAPTLRELLDRARSGR